MNFYTTLENNLLSNLYLYQTQRHLLTEQEQQQAKIEIAAQQLEQTNLPDQVAAAVQKLLKDPKFLGELEKVQAKGPDAVTTFLMSAAEAAVPVAQTARSANQQVTNESYEIDELEEGIVGRMGSLVSAGRDRLMGDKPTSNLPLRVQAILKHFEKLKTNVGSHLRELERDMATTSNIDVKVKDFVSQQIKDLGNTAASHGGITPTQSKLGDIRHGIGRGVGFMAGILTVGWAAGLMAPLAAPIASALGIAKGTATAAVTANAAKAAIFKTLHSLTTGQGLPPKKQIALALAIGGAAGLGGHKIGTLMQDLAKQKIEAVAVKVANQPSVHTLGGTQVLPGGGLDLPPGVTDSTLGGLDPASTTTAKAALGDNLRDKLGSTFDGKTSLYNDAGSAQAAQNKITNVVGDKLGNKASLAADAKAGGSFTPGIDADSPAPGEVGGIEVSEPADISQKQFFRYNKTSFNPKSSVDIYKKAIMGLMKAKAGNVDPTAYDTLVNPPGGREALKGMLKGMSKDQIIKAAAAAVKKQ